MRVTSDFWVAALMRQVFGEGGFGAILVRGGDSAGAIFIVMRDRRGEATLYGPAPQSEYREAGPDERLFVELLRTVDPQVIETRLDKERRFDPDVWVVEIEPARQDDLPFPVTKP
jgi:hypothetical protein